MPPNRRSTSLIERSKQEALLQATSMIERCLQAASGALDEAERSARSVARRMQLSDAHAALGRHAPVLRTEFPRLMMQGIDKALREDEQEAQRRRAGSEESILALLDDAEINRFVEASRLQQTAMPVIDRALGQLDSLMSSVRGLPVVRADLNPFRPDVLCTALMQTLEALPESVDIRSHWIRALSRPFADEMLSLYEALNGLLEEQGVEQARYRLKLTEGGGGGGGHGGSGAPGAPGGQGGSPGSPGGAEGHGTDGQLALVPMAGAMDGSLSAAGMQTHPVAGHPAFMPRMDQLARARPASGAAVMCEFLYGPQWIEAHDEPLPERYYQAVEAEMSRLGRLGPVDDDPFARQLELEQRRSQDVMARAPRAVHVDAALESEEWGELASAQARTRTLMQLKAQAKRISQVLGLDAVRALINQVASDGRVLAPVREAFVALEPALLRMALDHPRFFGEDDHPARVMIEAIAQRSFKYNDEFAPAFERFMQPLREAVLELVEHPAITPKDFQACQQALEAAWQELDAGEQQARERVQGSMEFAQERQVLADRIAWEFSLRSDMDGVPNAVADFLYRDWSLVLAHAQLTATGAKLDPGGYLAVVSDLLWSVNPRQAMRQPARLFEIIPGLLRTLRSGLTMLGKEPAETQAFFDALIRYHDPVLRLRRARSARDVEESGFARLSDELDTIPLESEPAPLERAAPRKAEQPWLARHEREAAGFEDTGPLDDDDDPALPPRAWLAGEAPASAAEASPAMHEGEAAARGARAPRPVEPVPETLSAADLRSRISAEVARWRRGDWVDLHVGGVWRRAQLSWTSDNGALFMFVSHGGLAHSMTRRTCERLLRQRHLHPVNIDPVVERALRELSEAAQAELEQTSQTEVASPPDSVADPVG